MSKNRNLAIRQSNLTVCGFVGAAVLPMLAVLVDELWFDILPFDVIWMFAVSLGVAVVFMTAIVFDKRTDERQIAAAAVVNELPSVEEIDQKAEFYLANDDDENFVHHVRSWSKDIKGQIAAFITPFKPTPLRKRADAIFEKASFAFKRGFFMLKLA